ncbi:hypothetical protein CTAYLR_002471 [Chrysophaeum taylorii]|uniref:Steroid 5-alpha reductase C-terminal domain-containing protein n=1 Tax=Chrysophaeum taylorii TaxID=2483200 RepID=A0AAD7UM19_9STRA|nr:hypothetical protein CTAYLR_002471 [Chrysophaeum taylorii]
MASIAELAVVSTVPTCIGFWKREYGVSYAYGSAMVAGAVLVLQTEIARGPAAWHAWAHLVYGVRLCLFLLWREVNVERFRRMREKIEEMAPPSETLGERILTRSPFILGCSMLYFCMSLPLLASARGTTTRAFAWPPLVAAYIGLVMAAVGDIHKSLAKARRGEMALVTTGLYRVMRHPNYTGEQLLWAASAVVGLALSTPVTRPFKTLFTWTAILLGQLGIQFVLMNATASLNDRQREKYGDDPDYRTWRAFLGFEIKKQMDQPSDTTSGVDDDRDHPDGDDKAVEASPP